MLALSPLTHASHRVSLRVTYLSSISGIAGIAGQTNYSCSKAGVIGYVEQLGADMAERGIGINAIAPGTYLHTMHLLTHSLTHSPRHVCKLPSSPEAAASLLLMRSK